MSHVAAFTAPGWTDGLGRRLVLDSAGQRWLRLRVRPELLREAPLFETSVRLASARAAAALAPDRALPREVDCLADGTLVITSPAPEARRIAGWLERAARAARPLPVDGAVTMTLRLLAAVTAFHAAMKTAHGTLSVERTWVQANGAIVLVDGVFAEALETLGWGRERLWRELRVAMPPSPSLPRFDPRVDLTQIAVIVIELLLGRPLGPDEYPQAVVDLVNEATPGAAVLPPDRIASGLRMWLQRALPTHPRAAFTTTTEALAVLERLAHDTEISRTGPRTLARWLDPAAAAESPRPVVPFRPAPPPVPVLPPPGASEPARGWWRSIGRLVERSVR